MKAIFSLPGLSNDVVLNLKAEATHFQPVQFYFSGAKKHHQTCLFIPVYHTSLADYYRDENHILQQQLILKRL